MHLRPLLIGAVVAVLSSSPACKRTEPVAPGTPAAPGAGQAPQADEVRADAGQAPAAEADAAPAPAAQPPSGEADAAAAPTGNPESAEILSRDPVTQKAKVKHVLVSWKELAPAFRGQQDPRGAQRSKADADALALQILDRVRKGEDIDKLMAELSEDPGSARTGRAYDVSEDAPLVPPFKRLSLRLNVNEAGAVQTDYGWHIIKRVE